MYNDLVPNKGAIRYPAWFTTVREDDKNEDSYHLGSIRAGLGRNIPFFADCISNIKWNENN